MDCIKLEPAEGVTEGLEGWQFPMAGAERAAALRGRYVLFKQRQQDRPGAAPALDTKAHHQAEIAAALARVRARRAEKH